jgi:hypothetical protein
MPMHRRCPEVLFGGSETEVCPQYPCRHTPCHDPDWLADKEDMLRDPFFTTILWWSLKDPLSYRRRLSAEEWALCEAKFERCRRLQRKRRQIKMEIRAYDKREEEEMNRYFDRSFDSFPEDIQRQHEESWREQHERGLEIFRRQGSGVGHIRGRGTQDA